MESAHLPRLAPLALFSLALAAWPVWTGAQETAPLEAPVVEHPPIQWTAFPDARFPVAGLPWFAENGGELRRLPAKRENEYPHDILGLAHDPTGGRIRFRTDANLIAIRLEYPRPPWMRNMSAIGQSGVDLYMDGTYWGNISADKDAKEGHVYEYIYFNRPDLPRKMREATFYLPLYEGVKVVAIGLDPGAGIEAPRPFALPSPVVFYGTSVTQGGCVSRGGMAFEAIIGRRLNVDFVNLGLSGAGKYEPIMGEFVADLEASCIVLDASNLPEAAANAKAYGPFVDTLRSRHPKTPIVVISPLYSAQELTSVTRQRQLRARREFTRKFVTERMAAGDENIYLVEGLDLLGTAQGAGLVDGAHLNDLGSQWVADGLTNRLAWILGLPFQGP